MYNTCKNFVGVFAISTFVLKIIAVVTMFIDHLGVTFPQTFGTEVRVIGRIAFPIFVYLLAEGFRHTKDVRKFLFRLFLFAVISEPFYDLALRTNWADFPGGVVDGIVFVLGNISLISDTNIFYTLFLGGMAIVVYDAVHAKVLPFITQTDDPEHSYSLAVAWQSGCAAFIPCLPFMAIAELLGTDYGAYGVVFILLMYILNPLKLRLIAMIVLCIWQHATLIRDTILGVAAEWYIDLNLRYLAILFTLIPVVLIWFYNGKRGGSSHKSVKWLFYASYPAHLAVYALIAFLIR